MRCFNRASSRLVCPEAQLSSAQLRNTLFCSAIQGLQSDRIHSKSLLQQLRAQYNQSGSDTIVRELYHENLVDPIVETSWYSRGVPTILVLLVQVILYVIVVIICGVFSFSRWKWQGMNDRSVRQPLALSIREGLSRGCLEAKSEPGVWQRDEARRRRVAPVVQPCGGEPNQT
jgi:hypothetical protein